MSSFACGNASYNLLANLSCHTVVFLLCCLKRDRNVLSLAVGNNNNADNENEHVDKDDTIQKEVGSATKCPRRSQKSSVEIC